MTQKGSHGSTSDPGDPYGSSTQPAPRGAADDRTQPATSAYYLAISDHETSSALQRILHGLRRTGAKTKVPPNGRWARFARASMGQSRSRQGDAAGYDRLAIGEHRMDLSGAPYLRPGFSPNRVVRADAESQALRWREKKRFDSPGD